MDNEERRTRSWDKHIAAANRRATLRRQLSAVLAGVARDDQCIVLADLLVERTAVASQDRPRIGLDQGRTKALLDALGNQPRASISSLADDVYGGHGKKEQGKVRSLLSFLKSRERVRNVGPGEWEVVAMQ